MQAAAVAATVALPMIDGFEVLSVTFCAPAIAKEWGLGKAALGGLFSSWLIGMALGSVLITPLADLVRRRPLTILSLLIMAIGMWGCEISDPFGANTDKVAMNAPPCSATPPSGPPCSPTIAIGPASAGWRSLDRPARHGFADQWPNGTRCRRRQRFR